MQFRKGHKTGFTSSACETRGKAHLESYSNLTVKFSESLYSEYNQIDENKARYFAGLDRTKCLK